MNMSFLTDHYNPKIEEFKNENSIMWQALLDICYKANTLSEAQGYVRDVFRKLDEGVKV